MLLALAQNSAVCTEVRIDLIDDSDVMHSRTWLHPTCFDASDLVDRVRWQLEGFLTASAKDDDAAHAFRGLVGVRIEPVAVDDAAHHQPGLFGSAGDERLHHALSRVQSMLGHQQVVTAAVSGGRWLRDRQLFTPWGERPVISRDPALPWPGSLPGPSPAEVFDPPRSLRVLARNNAEVTVDGRGSLSAPPASVEGCEVVAWAGPWPVHERRWDGGQSGYRFQLVDDHQRAWLAFLGDDGWHAEGRYR